MRRRSRPHRCHTARRYRSPVDDHLSTEQVGWILGKSSASVRDMIRAGEIEAVRLVEGFRIPKVEALRLGRERIEKEAGRKVSDKSSRA